ncbi:hypothetical protein BRC65_09500 [Halobacteriales archaeon QH_2_65_14]|nr:MAG: hypothetical protein BRC65_09500 [Halobacteriales archaeon QH_2_65_14]
MALDDSVISERANALAGWTLVGLMSLGGVGNVLAGTLLWGGFWLVFVGILSIPALVTRSWVAVVPWPLPAIAALSLVAREAGVYPESAGHLAVVALALAVVVELDVFTPVELSRRFAVAFAVLTTMAVEALWIIAQYYSDVWLGTEFLSTQTELQEDIVIVSAVGFVVGVLFYWYLSAADGESTDVHSTGHRENT